MPATKPTTKKKADKKPQPPSEKAALLAALAEKLGTSADEVELRALRELSEKLAGDAAPPEPAAKAAAPEHHAPRGSQGFLPRRLFLLLDGRGLDGRGLPIEVIDSPTLVGSGKMCGIWVNSPQIETRHLSIVQAGDDWVLSDLGSEKGTLLGDQPVQKRVLQHGDEFRLAGYLRLRAEFR